MVPRGPQPQARSAFRAREDRLAVEERQHDEPPVPSLFDLVDPADVRVIKRRSLDLVEESGLDLLVSELVGREELESYPPLQTGVLGLVDCAHSTAAEFFDDPVVGNDTSYHARCNVSNEFAAHSGITRTDRREPERPPPEARTAHN